MTTPTRAPSHTAYQVLDRGEGKKGHWREIGAAWSHAKGLTLRLDALPLNGEVVLIDRAEQGEKAGADHEAG